MYSSAVKRARGRRHKPNGSDYIFDRVMLFIFQSEKEKPEGGKKETPVQNRPVTDYRPQTQSRPVNSTQSSMQRSNIQGRQAAVRTAGGTAGGMTPGKGSSVSRTVEKKTTVSRQAKSTTEMLEEKQDRMRWSIRKRKEDSLQRNAAFMGSCVMRNVICREI